MSALTPRDTPTPPPRLPVFVRLFKSTQDGVYNVRILYDISSEQSYPDVTES